jgi:hypothetical protein
VTLPPGIAQRMAEAARFRSTGAALRRLRATRARMNNPTAAPALEEARQLWGEIGTAMAQPECGLPEPLRLGLTRMGFEVLAELQAPSPNLPLLIALHEKVAGALTPVGGWDAAMPGFGPGQPLQT